jgi:ribonuclease HIII
MTQNTVSIQLNSQEANLAKQILLSAGWVEEENNNEYILLRMRNKDGSVVSLYTSKKIVFQGKEDFDFLVGQIKGSDNVNEFNPHIGVDEVGKGDYFGPLVVASCFVNEEFFKKVISLGVADSKKFSDRKIMELYGKIKDYPYKYISIVYPLEYNRLILETGNVAILLARQHSFVIEKALLDLKSKGIECKKVVIDQFSSKKSRVLDELGELGSSIAFEQYHKGESDIAVACASVFARAIFLQEMEKMSNLYNFEFPKGSSNVIERARLFVKQKSQEELKKVAKISFKTTKSVLR